VDVATEAVRGVGALDHRRQLRIADTGQVARRAHRAGPDADLDEVGAGQDQFLGHLAGDDVAGHDDELRMAAAQAGDEGDEVLVIAVGDVDAHELHRARRGLHQLLELLLVGARDAHRVESRRLAFDGSEEADVFVEAVVLVQGRRQPEALERLRHLEGADGVHVGADDRNAPVRCLGMAESELARDVDLAARGQRRTLRADQHVPVIELDLVFDMHARVSGRWRPHKCRVWAGAEPRPSMAVRRQRTGRAAR